MLIGASSSLAADDDSYRSSDVGKIRDVRVAMDVTGTVHLRPGEKEGASLPLKVQGRLQYQERLLRLNQPVQVARYYEEAQVNIQVGKGSTTNQLPPDTHYFLLTSNPDPQSARLRVQRPDGPLSPEQAELLELPLESAMLSALLPQDVSAKNVNDRWEPTNQALAALLGIDSVTQNSVECRFYTTRGTSAQVYIKGKVLGAIEGVATEIDLNGSLEYDTKQESIRTAQFTLHESRSIGRAQPGFDVTAKIELTLQESPRTTRLSDQILASWELDSHRELEPLSYVSKAGGFRLVHDRKWHLMQDSPGVTVLRLVDRGDLIAQCNISRLEDLSDGKRIGLDEFRNDVREAVAEQAGQIIEAESTQRKDDSEVLRVVASGVVSDVSLQWIYYHITDPQGHRAAVIISVESELFERFAAADQALVESLTLQAKPTPTAASAAQSSQPTTKK